jgi:hypothetical protein
VPATAGGDASEDRGESGNRCVAATCLAPKTAVGQPVRQPARPSAPARTTATSGTATWGRRNQDPGPESPGPESPGPESPGPESPGPERAEPQLRQKRANSLFCSPHAKHRPLPANGGTPPQPLCFRKYASNQTPRNSSGASV